MNLQLLSELSKLDIAAANIAACITILVLTKAGMFSSTAKFQRDGERALRHYYASQVGDEIADEIFHA